MAEYGSLHYYPQSNIDCQTLLSQPDRFRHSGWLRKRSFRNKLKLFYWPQVYLVLSGGCIYYYGSEFSKKSHSFSLYGYNSVMRDSEMQDALWVFKIIHTHAEFKTYYFSASSEREMKEWMKVIKREMDRANNKDTSSKHKKSRGRADGKDFDEESMTYQDIEEKLYDDPASLILPKNYKNKRNSEIDSDDDMDGRPPVAPPVPPRPGPGDKPTEKKTKRKISKGDINNRPPKELPKADVREDADTIRERRTRGDGASMVEKTKEDEPMTQEEYWASIYLDEEESPIEATEVIRKIAEDGVYLVKRCKNGTFTLCFYALNLPRKMKISQNDENRFFLSKNSCTADSIEELMYHYYENPLPTTQFHLRLETPYKLHPKFKSVWMEKK